MGRIGHWAGDVGPQRRADHADGPPRWVLPAAAHGEGEVVCTRYGVSGQQFAHGVPRPRVRIAAVGPPCRAPPPPPQVLVLSRGPGFPHLCPASRVCSPRAQSFSAPCPPLRLGFNESSRTAAVVFWLGFWFWWENPGAELGRVFATLAGGGTGGDQAPCGVAGGGRRVTRRCRRRCGGVLCPWPGGGGRFFPRGIPSEVSGWIERARRARLGPARIKKGSPLRLEIRASNIYPFEGGPPPPHDPLDRRTSVVRSSEIL
jgi:hypothetical protein